MGKLISLGINLSKVDKSKLTESKTGEKWLNITVELKDVADNYGNDVSCWQSQSKEEREAKVNRVYLGNGKVVYSGGGAAQPAQQPAAAKPAVGNPFDDDLPL